MNEKIDIDTNLEPAIAYFEGQAGLAAAFGLHAMAITQWKRRGIPVERVLEISRLTKGKVQPYQIKPNLFKDFVYMPPPSGFSS